MNTPRARLSERLTGYLIDLALLSAVILGAFALFLATAVTLYAIAGLNLD